MKVITVVALALTAGSVSCASIFKNKEENENIVSKVVEGVGKATAQSENMKGDPLSSSIIADLKKFMNNPEINGILGGESIYNEISNSEAFRKILKDDKLKNILSGDVVNNLMSGNFDNLHENDELHDKIDEVMADLLQIDKGKVAEHRKQVFDKVSDHFKEKKSFNLDL